MKKVHLILCIILSSIFCSSQLQIAVYSYAPNFQIFDLTDILHLNDSFYLRIDEINIKHHIEVYDLMDHFNISIVGENLIKNFADEITLQMFLISSTWFVNQTKPFSLFQNGTLVDYEIRNLVNPEHFNEATYNLITDYSNGVYSFAAFNITFPHNSVTNITYELTGKYEVNNDTDEIHFLYNLASFDMWSGAISETVEYQIIGIQPDYYRDKSEYYDMECIVTEVPGGKNYRYVWDSEPTSEFETKLVYYTNRVINWTIFPIFLSLLILIIIKKQKWKKSRIDTY